MSDQQKHAAALTYARRQSLISVLGLTTAEPDADAVSTDTINNDDVVQLEEMLEESGADPARFRRYMKVNKLSEILVSDYETAIFALRQKILRKKKAGT